MHEDEVLGKAYDARLMRRLLTYLRPYKRQVAIALGAIVAFSMLELAPPYLVKLIIDRYIPASDLEGVALVAVLYLAAQAGSFLLEFLQTWTLQMLGQRIMFDIRMELYSHLQKLDLRFYDRNPVGRLMTRVTSDVDVLNDLFTSGVVSIFGDVFTLVGIMAVLVMMDWRLALITFSVLPLIARIVPHRAHLDRTDQCVPAGADHRDDDGAAVPPRRKGLCPLRRDRPRTPRRQHRFDLLLRRVLSGD
jgi:ATP-binding cassette subfamily B multidrug efflux pump